MSDSTMPPAQQANEQKQPAQEELVSQRDIEHHYWPPTNDSDDTERPQHGGTLHDSATHPGQLTHIILYNNANPRWSADKIIYTKSGLELLPKPATGEGLVNPGPNINPVTNETQQPPSSDPSGPVAIFEQKLQTRDLHTRAYQFVGYYNITRVAFLEPGSQELVRMLEQKWERRDKFGNVRTAQRDGDKWRESMGFRWAVVKLEPAEEGATEPPRVERVEREGDVPTTTS
ncbi:hypothetical protein MBLNU230_g0181t1 [Neophaeotheca triangularis]